MIIYILSIVFYFATVLMGIGDRNKKATLLSVLDFAVALINLILIFTRHISMSVIINLLLAVPHVFVLLIALLFIIVPDKPVKKDKAETVSAPFAPPTNIPLSEHVADEQTEEPIEEEEKISSERVFLSDFGSCRAEGKKEDFYITVYPKDSEAIQFRVQGGQIHSYCKQSMDEHKTYGKCEEYGEV